MQVSIIKEISSREQRVAASPESVKLLLRLGADVLIEEGAGVLSGFIDESFQSAGAKIVNRLECLKANICLCVQMPSKEDIDKMNDNTILVGILNPYENKNSFNDLIHNKITACCMELIPRISRAQSMDVLSSQANLSGYRSVIDAAEQFGKAFPMMMTAAGRVNPAKVMVLGVGVAGLQAIATAKRLGAAVSATDVRIATKEQVESLGAKFLMVDGSENLETEGGYAKETSEEFKIKQEELLSETLKKIDVVICTALIPGKKAPVIVKEQMINNMKPGSVIYDLAAIQGGNTALTEVDKLVIKNGVKIMGEANILNKLPVSASSLYAKNVFNFVSNLYDKENKKININLEDEIILKTIVK